MRGALAALGALAAAACSADIEGGAYYCGPEELCPPELVCDVPSHLCMPPAEAGPYACVGGPALPTASCGPDALSTNGCVRSADGGASIALATAATCPTHVQAQLTYPVAFMPLAMTVHDASGAAVVTATACHTSHGGAVDACADFVAEPGATYTFNVAAATGAATCGGACAFNDFDLAVQVLRP